jgi:hypothetical protein
MIGIALVALVVLRNVKREGRFRRELFENRTRLELTKIFEMSYSNTTISYKEFQRAWLDIAGILRVNPGLLRPTDQLTMLIPPFFHTQCDVDDLEVYAIQHAKQETNSFETIDDVIRIVCQRSS